MKYIQRITLDIFIADEIIHSLGKSNDNPQQASKSVILVVEFLN